MAWSGRPSAALVACLLVGCGSSKDPVQQRLAQLEEAAESRDAAAFGEGLSPAFRGGGLDRAGAVAELRRYFALYESVALEVYGVESDRTAGRASVRCVVTFSGRGKAFGGLDKLLPPEAAYRFSLEMADEGGTWLVGSASWEIVAPSPPPA
jgi:hypothetical protein